MMKNRYLILFVFILTACVSGESQIMDKVYKPELPKKPPLLDKEKIESLSKGPNICIKAYLNEEPTLDIELINKLTSGYINNQLKAIKNYSESRPRDLNLPENDARAIWFDFKTLKKFLYYIEYHSEKKGIDKNRLGIRAYYAAYPSIDEMRSYEDLQLVPEEYENKHTLILIPTYEYQDRNIDFDPSKDESQIIVNPPGQNAGEETLGLVVYDKKEERTDARNHGSLWPPRNDVPDDISRTSQGISFPNPEYE